MDFRKYLGILLMSIGLLPYRADAFQESSFDPYSSQLGNNMFDGFDGGGFFSDFNLGGFSESFDVTNMAGQFTSGSLDSLTNNMSLDSLGDLGGIGDTSDFMGSGGESGGFSNYQNLGIPGPTDFEVMFNADWSKLVSSWKLKGVGFCREKWKIKACFKLEHHYPTGLVEMTKKKDKSLVLSPLPMILKVIFSKAADLALRSMFGFSRSTSAGHGASSVHASPFQFMEGTVYQFPDIRPWLEYMGQSNPYIKAAAELLKRMMCQTGNPGTIRTVYSTEADFLFWRIGLHDIMKVMSFGSLASRCGAMSVKGGGSNYCIAGFGKIYPRVGWNINYLETASSLMGAFRTISMANKGGGVKLQGYGYSLKTGGVLQLLKPDKGTCFDLLGTKELYKHKNDRARGAAYLYVHWPKVYCCNGCEGTKQVD